MGETGEEGQGVAESDDIARHRRDRKSQTRHLPRRHGDAEKTKNRKSGNLNVKTGTPWDESRKSFRSWDERGRVSPFTSSPSPLCTPPQTPSCCPHAA